MSIPAEVIWYSPWAKEEHVLRYEFRRELDDRNLVRLYETMNDVRLLKERYNDGIARKFLEVGCATGDLYRYLRLALPHLTYSGIDVSEPAARQARSKYPGVNFLVVQAGEPLQQVWQKASGLSHAQIVYAADVIHHQVKPFDFLRELITLSSEALIFRCRTRDVGPTQWDPARSRQAHYGGWVPYIVLNLEELIEEIRRLAPACEVAVYRSHLILGGHYSRELPPACSVRETGTSETSIGLFFKTEHRGRVTLRDRADNRPNTTWDHKWRSLRRRFLKVSCHAE